MGEGPARYRLSGIIRSQTGNVAIINGSFFAEGEAVDGQARLVKISERQVELELPGGKVRRLSLSP